MTTLRKFTVAVVAAATLGSAAYFTPVATANAGGYYGPGNGYYHYNPRPYRRHCRWVRVPYRWDYYGRPIGWRRVWRCW